MLGRFHQRAGLLGVELPASREQRQFVEEGPPELEEPLHRLPQREPDLGGHPAVVDGFGGRLHEVVTSPLLVTIVEVRQQLLRQQAAVDAEPLALFGLEGADPGERPPCVTRLTTIRSGEPCGSETAGAQAAPPRSRLRNHSLERLPVETAVTARRGVDADLAGVAPAAQRLRRNTQEPACFAQPEPGACISRRRHQTYPNLF